MTEIISWIVEASRRIGYPGIAALMFLQSSFFPFPSEVVMPPAGFNASKGEMNLVVAILVGIAGSLLGAYFNYYLAVLCGRPAILKYGKYVGLSKAKLERVERFFKVHGEMTTFSCRLIPGIRQVISFPAGLARMNLLKFTVYTGLGAGIWVTILALIGFWIGKNELLLREHLRGSMNKAIFWLLVFVAVTVAAYIWYYLKFKRFKLREEKRNC